MPSWGKNLSAQWRSPQDIFSLLLLIGGDIIHSALAQLSGNEAFIPAPVPFSFGWVAYAYNSIMLAIGEGRLMPPTTDCASVVINASNGISRVNNSWVLGRVLRDMEPEVKPDVALKIDICKLTASKGWLVRHDSLWWTGVLIILAQLAIAAISAALYEDWTNLVITSGGTTLALISSLSPQWRREKWACRKLKPFKEKTVSITKGNGSQYILVMKAKGGELNLEDLASGRSYPSSSSKGLAVVLAALWIALLITATSVKNHSWHLLGIGLLGMLGNVYAAGARRSPEGHGLPLSIEMTIENMRVMDALKEVEKQYTGVGSSLLATFFPQGLSISEEEWWFQHGRKIPFSTVQVVDSQTSMAAPQANATSP